MAKRREPARAAGHEDRLESDLKRSVRAGRGTNVYLDVADVVGHCRCDFVEHVIDFGGGTLRNQFHATIGQVADKSCYGVSLSDPTRGIPKADSLDATAVQNAARLSLFGHGP